jgi:hypothetical protein
MTRSNEKTAINILAGMLAMLYIGYRLRWLFHPQPFTATETAVFVAVFVVLTLWLMRLRVAATVPESYNFPAARIEDFPQLDRATFDRYAQELENIGFAGAEDFSLVGQGGKTIPSFCRLYLFPKEKMYAELAQLFPAQMKMPVLCSIQTHFNHDWSLGVANNKPQPAAVFIRNPHGVGRAMPGKTPFELLQAHKEWRMQMIEDLGIEPQPVSVAAYRQHQQTRAQQRAAQVRHGSFIARLGIFYKRKVAPVADWRGDWPKEAAKRGSPRSFMESE